MLPITLATEDQLSEAVALRILRDFPSLPVGLLLRQNGNGYLRKRLPNFCEMAKSGPVIVFTDLDTDICPSALKQDWFGNRQPPKWLLFRVVEREIESWLLADHDAITALIGNTVRVHLPDVPDGLADPKASLLALARRGDRGVQRDLLPQPGANASKGLAYNKRLADLVRDMWDPGRAMSRSPSLRRAVRRIAELANAWPIPPHV